MKTSYGDFEEFVKANYPADKILYDYHYAVDNLWRRFEENLAKLDIRGLLDSVRGIFELSEDENDTLDITCDSWFAEIITKELVSADTLKKMFWAWVMSIDEPIKPYRKRFKFNGEDERLYINFHSYTSVYMQYFSLLIL